MRLLFLLLCGSLSLYGVCREEDPLFAGNFVAFSGQNVEPGNFTVQPFLYFTRFNGTYNSESDLVSNLNVHQNQLEVDLAWGLLPGVAMTLELFGSQVHNEGRERYLFGDLVLFFGFQLLKEKRGCSLPNVRFLVGEVFPTGKYDQLEGGFSGIDGVGTGAYSTFLTFIASKTYYGAHPFIWTVNLYSFLSSEVDLKGRNAYFFDFPDFKGKVQPGAAFEAVFSFEYKFNRPWGCGMDIYFEQQNRATLKQKSSEDSLVDIPSSHRLSLVPTIEYNFNKKASMLGGFWFTAAGRNTLAFQSFVFSFYREF